MLDPSQIPLSLYVHLPWCVSKCPYCDFNSHGLKGDLPEDRYVDALLRDLEGQLDTNDPRSLVSIFLGGGTPSLFSAAAIARLLDGIRDRLTLIDDIEITLEANPGTVEQARFESYRAAGINRLSIGIQSFDPQQLKTLGRIHDKTEAIGAVESAGAAGFDNFNLDLMYALPEQTTEQALADLQQAIALGPAHISWYQLTLEPGTPFHYQPPEIPDNDASWAIQQAGQALLANSGYEQYEISAYARGGQQCRHNLNYWQYGDYLGIGAGAHGKISLSGNRIQRRIKPKHPRGYMRSPDQADISYVLPEDRPLEFLMNSLRLNNGFNSETYQRNTGLDTGTLKNFINSAMLDGLMENDHGQIHTTALGQQHLDGLLSSLLPEEVEP